MTYTFHFACLWNSHVYVASLYAHLLHLIFAGIKNLFSLITLSHVHLILSPARRAFKGTGILVPQQGRDLDETGTPSICAIFLCHLCRPVRWYICLWSTQISRLTKILPTEVALQSGPLSHSHPL